MNKPPFRLFDDEKAIEVLPEWWLTTSERTGMSVNVIHACEPALEEDGAVETDRTDDGYLMNAMEDRECQYCRIPVPKKLVSLYKLMGGE